MTLPVGARLGPYEILAPLGAGGMGEVYRARDTRLGREVALKVIPEAVAANPEVLRRFEREARAASALNHPNVVALHDVGRDGDVSWIAMELVDGTSLRDSLDGAMPARRLLPIAAQIADGLAAAHEKGIVHRDLKPENVMVGRKRVLSSGWASAQGLAWSRDGREVWQPIEIDRLDPATGPRGAWRTIAPPHAGGYAVDAFVVADPQGGAVAYNTFRVLSSLFVVDGLK